MAPDAGVHVKVARQVALLGLVAPKIQGHAGNGLGANQLAHLAADGLALFVPGLHRAAEQAALHFTRHLGQLAVAAYKGAGKVGAAGDVAPPNVWRTQAFKLRRAPALCIGAQGGASAAQGTHGAQVAAGGQVHIGFLAIGKEGRARTIFCPWASTVRPPGLPSKMQQVVPLSRPLVCAFHMTQPVELYQW